MKRLQNKIAESRFALPVTAVYALTVWLVMCAINCRGYAELAVFALSAYLMAELNNRNALIRVYSRMVSCTFLALGTMAAPVTGSLPVLAVQLCFIAAYLLLFSSYQDKRAQGKMFYAFAFIGVAGAFARSVQLNYLASLGVFQRYYSYGRNPPFPLVGYDETYKVVPAVGQI